MGYWGLILSTSDLSTCCLPISPLLGFKLDINFRTAWKAFGQTSCRSHQCPEFWSIRSWALSLLRSLEGICRGENIDAWKDAALKNKMGSSVPVFLFSDVVGFETQEDVGCHLGHQFQFGSLPIGQVDDFVNLSGGLPFFFL